MATIANPVQVQKFLKGLDYPASKQDLIECARREGADENVLYTLGRLPERTYHGPNAISEEIGQLR